MPTPYEVLLARVKQKIATEADWLAISAELGPVFEGEQCFVWSDTGVAVNFKIGDGTKTFAELPYFIAYYSGVTNQKVLSYVGKTGAFNIPSVIRDKSFITDLIIINNAGVSQALNIGTTDGGSELASVSLFNGVNVLGLNKYFTGSTTVYFSGLTNYSIFLLYFQLDEAPAIPPASPGTKAGFVYGTVYSFTPMYLGHSAASWNFTTGIGLAGTPYEGCIILGTNSTPNFDETYLIGFASGDSPGDTVGANTVSLIATNIPKFHIPLPNSSTNGISDNADDRAVMIPTGQQYINIGEDTPVPVNIKPKSRKVIMFTGAPTT